MTQSAIVSSREIEDAIHTFVTKQLGNCWATQIWKSVNSMVDAFNDDDSVLDALIYSLSDEVKEYFDLDEIADLFTREISVFGTSLSDIELEYVQAHQSILVTKLEPIVQPTVSDFLTEWSESIDRGDYVPESMERALDTLRRNHVT